MSLWYPRARITDFDDDLGPFAPNGDGQPAAAGHRLEGVQNEIDNDQFEKVLHALGIKRVRYERQLPLDCGSHRGLARSEHQRVL